MPALLIKDGYTLDGKVPARGPWPAVCFRYRPALPEDSQEYLHQISQVSGKARIKPAVELLAAQLCGWDVRNEKGELEDITPENLRRLPHPVFTKMVDTVLGYGYAEQEADLKN